MFSDPRESSDTPLNTAPLASRPGDPWPGPSSRDSVPPDPFGSGGFLLQRCSITGPGRWHIANAAAGPVPPEKERLDRRGGCEG